MVPGIWDVGEKQTDIVSFCLENSEGFISVLRFSDMEPSVSQSLGNYHADDWFIFRYDHYLIAAIGCWLIHILLNKQLRRSFRQLDHTWA